MQADIWVIAHAAPVGQVRRALPAKSLITSRASIEPLSCASLLNKNLDLKTQLQDTYEHSMRRYPVQSGPASITTATWIQLRLQILRLILICSRRRLLDGVLGFGVNLVERKE